MATRIRHILVAIGNAGHSPGNALRKAAILARAAGASIELFHAIDAPLAIHGLRRKLAADVMKQRSRDVELKYQRRLDRFKRAPFLHKLRVSCHVSRDSPAHEAIVRRALRTSADLVIAATRPHRFGGRLLLRNTDWELIRQCPCPLLLAKTSAAYERPVILAAVDPLHAHSKPARLDALLLQTGARITALLGGSLHVFHAYMPIVNLVPMPAGPSVPLALPPEAEELHGAQIARTFNELARGAGIAPARRHLRMGDVPTQLDAVIEETRAKIAVMGAVSRSGLRRVFIGSTAERALDGLRCDLLIVKPRGFRTGVARRAPATVV